MLRDSKAFKDRFQRWKAGEKVYDAGLPRYGDGKESTVGEFARLFRNPGITGSIRSKKLQYDPSDDAYLARFPFEVNVTGVNRKPKSVSPHMHIQKTPITTGEILGGMIDPMRFLSPTNDVRAVYDAVRYSDSALDFGRRLFQPNPGIVTHKFEEEHPYLSMAANAIGDAVIGGAANSGRKILSSGGFAIANKLGNSIRWVPINRRGGVKSQINLGDTFVKDSGGKSKLITGVDWVLSGGSGEGRKLYDAAIKLSHKQGGDGIVTGNNLFSADKTNGMYQHYPNKVLLNNNGTWKTSPDLPYLPDKISVNNIEDFLKNTPRGHQNYVEFDGAPVYRLGQPSQNVPLFTPFLTINRAKKALLNFGNIRLKPSLQNEADITPKGLLNDEPLIARGTNDVTDAQSPILDDFHRIYLSKSDDVIFDRFKNQEYDVEYFLAKPEYRQFLHRGEYAAGDRFFYMSGSPELSRYKWFSSGETDNIPYMLNVDEINQYLGLAPLYIRTPVLVPPETVGRIDWSDYTKRFIDKVFDDVDNNGPLSSHLKRSDIYPTDLAYNIEHPLSFWEGESFSFGKIRALTEGFSRAIAENLYVKNSLENSIYRVLRSNGYKGSDFTIGPDDVNYADIDYLIRKVFPLMGGTDRFELVQKAIRDMMKRDPEAAKLLYMSYESAYDNASASRKGTMYVPLNRPNFTNTVSHELSHLEDRGGVPHVTGIQNMRPPTVSPLFKKAFDVPKDIRNYFLGYNWNNATEMAARATLLKDYFRLLPGERLDPRQVRYAKLKYISDTGMDNNMLEFFKSIKDLDYATMWMNAFGK